MESWFISAQLDQKEPANHSRNKLEGFKNEAETEVQHLYNIFGLIFASYSPINSGIRFP